MTDRERRQLPRTGAGRSAEPGAVSRSRTRTVDIGAAADKVFAFLVDPLNWPRYAVVNLRAVRPGQDGWYRATTRSGEGEIRITPAREFGIFDHVWRDPQASWQVKARVVPNGGGATVMMTFFQPPAMSDAQFDAAMGDMDTEMSALRRVLEA